MEFENWITEVSDNLPNFTVRIFLLSFFLIWLSISILFFLIRTKKRKKKKIKFTFRYLIVGSILLLLTACTYFFFDSYLKSFFGNNLIYILIPLGISSLIYFLKQILTIFRKRKVLKIFTLTEISLIFTLTLALCIVSLFTVPHVSMSKDSKVLETAGEITLNFTSPLKKSDLRITISPESNITLEYEYFLGLETLVESVKIVPLESFLPGQKVVIYTTGIQRIFPWANKHENSQEFFTPKAPEIEEVVLGTDIENVSVIQPITLDLDSKDQQSIEWSAVFTPYAEYKIIRDLDDTVTIQPEKLKQGTQYNLEVIKSIIIYNPLTLEKISTQSEEVESELTFKTAPAPGITSFNRESGYVSNSEPLKINFEVPINEDTLKDRILISPAIDGEISLSSDKKQLIFTPESSFAKNTEYKITILKGLENILGGYIEQDITLTFKTPGYVSLLYASPRNWSTNVSLTTSSISLTFNQPVDHTTVQERFSISPSINGTFSWNGNTLYYKFANTLPYSTKYTVSIGKGIKAIYGIDSTSTISTSFTTKHQTFLLNVPLYYQQESFTCNLAAARMVLAYKGVSVSESSIKSSVGVGLDPNADWVDKYGVHWGPISSYISSKGVSNTVKSSWNLTSALSEVKKGNPVLVYVYNGRTLPKGAFTLDGGYTGYKGMHSEIIVGYIGTPESPTTVITNDPWLGRRYQSVSSFKYYWSYLGYIGIVIY
ncbi:MAG: Ig-like domain-containing protein [Candidatus Dojkabacteria bacterium]|jgi:hypothetical protein|nr:Ig-like domain-containing protein [Candidatus Dojkabacteria bacterium]